VLADPPHRRRRRREAPPAALPIVRRLEAVQRHRDVREPDIASRRHPLLIERLRPRHHPARHARLHHGTRDLLPVRPQVRLAPEERHVPHPDLGKLPHDSEALGRRQLARPRLARPRAAMPTRQLADAGRDKHRRAG